MRIVANHNEKLCGYIERVPAGYEVLTGQRIPTEYYAIIQEVDGYPTILGNYPDRQAAQMAVEQWFRDREIPFKTAMNLPDGPR